MLPPQPRDTDLEPVTIFESSEDLAIGLAKAALEDSGIPYWMQSDETPGRLVLSPIWFPQCRFLVPREYEPEARALLEALASPMESDWEQAGGSGEEDDESA